jgi:hypothetical protein
MGILLFGLFTIIISTLVLYGITREIINDIKNRTATRLQCFGYFLISLGLLWFIVVGTMLVSSNNYTFNRHIHRYQRGDYRKITIYDSLSNEREFKYEILY